MKELKIRRGNFQEEDYIKKLSNYRAKIDMIDNDLVEILGKRMILSDKIGKLKKDKNVAVLQSKRWNEILGKMILEGKDNGLSEEFVLKIFKAIHQESINHQNKILKN
jgi:chorismate mutase